MFCDSVIVDLPFDVKSRFCSVVVAPSRYLLYYCLFVGSRVA